MIFHRWSAAVSGHALQLQRRGKTVIFGLRVYLRLSAVFILQRETYSFFLPVIITSIIIAIVVVSLFSLRDGL